MAFKSGTSQDVNAPAGRTKVLVVGGVAAVLGAVLGFVAGADIGGNWFTSVTLAGRRGYEATGLLGAPIGAIVLGAVGVWWARRSRSYSDLKK